MYRLINPDFTYNSDTFVESVMENRGIKNLERFLEPNSSDEIHYSKLNNIYEAVKLFKKIEQKDKAVINIALIVDSDIDGFSSSAILASYVEDNFPHIKLHFLFHAGKTHGITDEMVMEVLRLNELHSLDLLVVADAGSSDYENQAKIKNNAGVPILVLDHHEVEEGESEFALVVNNQISPEYDNKALSGVGIVYKFLQALDDVYGIMQADEYLDLVALGNISDSMDLTSPETRYYVYEGLKNIKNKFFKEIIMKQIGNMKRVYPQALAFSVIPKMNGIIRVGTAEEKSDLFNAFRGVEETYYNSRSKKNETLPQKVTRLCTNAHNNQKKLRNSWLEVFNEHIESNDLNSNAFLLIEIDDNMTIKKNRKDVTFNRDLGGLIAGNLSSDYRKPVLMLIWDEDKKQYSGSLRGYDRTMKNTKDFLQGLELFEYLGGHQNACGFRIDKEPLGKLNFAINNKLGGQDLVGQQDIDVDFYLDDEELTTEIVDKVYEYEYLWGKGAEKPLFATDIVVDTNKIKKSASSSMIEWYHNDIKFVQFTGDKRLVDLSEDGHIVKLTLVGSLSVNHFNGKSTPQFLIEDVSIGELMTEFKEIPTVGASDLDDLFNW